MIHINKTDLSDFYKDVYGFRPRNHYKEWWTKSELEEEYNHLSKICEINMEEEKTREDQALEEFNKLVDETIAYGVGDRKTAIKWLMNADEFSQDIEHFFWNFGLSWEKIDEFVNFMKG